MSSDSAFGVRFTRIWVAVYTRGLDPGDAERRKLEIESDLYEHTRDVGPRGILGRALRGIPADVWWRIQTRLERAGEARRDKTMTATTTTRLGTSRQMGTFMRKELVVLGVAIAALLAALPFSSEPNPEAEAAQAFVDDLTAAAASIRAGEAAPEDFTREGHAFTGVSASLDDGSTAAVLAGPHDGRCFTVYWQSPGIVGPRGGVLEPALACSVPQEFFSALGSPPFVEVFPGTAPFDVTELVTRPGLARHDVVPAYPAERTAAWFLPVSLILLAIIFWNAAGIVIKLLVHWSSQRRRWETLLGTE